MAQDKAPGARLKSALTSIQEDFQRRTKILPHAFCINPTDFKRAGCRRFRNAIIKPDERLKRREVVVMDGRAFLTWKFQRQLKGLPV